MLIIVCKDRDDAIKQIDEQCIELYRLKLKVHNMINRKLGLEKNPYFLNTDQGSLRISKSFYSKYFRTFMERTRINVLYYIKM